MADESVPVRVFIPLGRTEATPIDPYEHVLSPEELKLVRGLLAALDNRDRLEQLLRQLSDAVRTVDDTLADLREANANAARAASEKRSTEEIIESEHQAEMSELRAAREESRMQLQAVLRVFEARVARLEHASGAELSADELAELERAGVKVPR